MTQDDKPQGLMSAEALASRKEWFAFRYPGDSGYGDVREVGTNTLIISGILAACEGIAEEHNNIPRLLAHIAAQDAQIRNYDNMVEIYASHHSGCPRAEFLDRDCECGYTELIRLCRLAKDE